LVVDAVAAASRLVRQRLRVALLRLGLRDVGGFALRGRRLGGFLRDRLDGALLFLLGGAGLRAGDGRERSRDQRNEKLAHG
jgi:hypothetical protein